AAFSSGASKVRMASYGPSVQKMLWCRFPAFSSVSIRFRFAAIASLLGTPSNLTSAMKYMASTTPVQGEWRCTMIYIKVHPNGRAGHGTAVLRNHGRDTADGQTRWSQRAAPGRGRIAG